MIQRLLNDPIGKIILSIILGVGLASVFRIACTSGNDCFIVKAPKSKDISDYVYKIDNQCFKYTPVASECDIRKV